MADANDLDDYPDPQDIRTQLSSVIRQFLAGQLSVIATARLLSAFHPYAEPEIREALIPFVAVDSETDALPVGEVRQYWRADSLERKDREIAEVEDFYRDSAIEDATRLLCLLEDAS